MEVEVAEGKGEEGRYFSQGDNKPSAETKFLLINKTDGAIVKGSLLSVLCLQLISLFVPHHFVET